MRYFLYTLLPFFLLPLVALGQTSPSQDQNYVRQINYQTALDQGEVEAIDFDDLPINNDKKIENIVYYDGLGRPNQSVAIRAGGNREDLVTPVDYDDLGRQPKDWLPFPDLGNNGEFNPNVHTPLLGYYENEYPDGFHPYTINPYSEKRFEDSPLNRVLEQGAPGSDWKIDPVADTDHTIKFGYDFNSGSEVWNFSVIYENGTDDPELELDGTYTVNTLSRTITKDENWQPADGSTGRVLEFQNKQGQTLLKRQTALDANNQSYNLDTYYIYDDYGNLVYVLSPEGTAQIVSNSALVPGHDLILDKLCYQYHYDHRNRLVWKKIPGKGAEKIIYDSLDRPGLTQDANLALSNQWLFTKYDALNRVVYTGIYSPPLGLDVEQDFLQHTVGAISEARTPTASTIGGKSFFYSNLAYPTTSSAMEVLTINYYDDYVDYTVENGTLVLTPPTDVLGAKTTLDASVTTTTQGLPTVSWVKVLDTQMWTTTVTAYDSRGRALQMDSYNQYLQTRDWNRSKLDPISGRVLETHSTHAKTGQSTLLVSDYFAYDHMGRLLSQKQQIGNSPLQLIAENHYDELGQLVLKDVGGETEFDGYTLLTLAEATFDGTLTKTGTTNSWDSGAKTKGKVVGNGGINFTVAQEDKLLRAGLLKTTTSNDSWTTGYDYGLYFINTDTDSDGHKDMKAIVNGVEQSTIYEYDEGDSFSIGRLGTSVTFKKNNVAFLTLTGQPSAPGLVGKVSFKSPGAQVTEFALFGGNIDKKLQNVDYAYNIRGWLTDINDIEAGAGGIEEIGNVDLFNFRINYNTVEGNAANTPLYNGNIAQTLWKTMSTDKKVRGYAYTYDKLNRIVKAKSYKGTNLGVMAAVIDHDVDNIDFDRNGNIMHLKRWGSNGDGTVHDVWDNLQYGYDGNRLTSVIDATGTSPLGNEGFFAQVYNPNDQYAYDENGNMELDTNKGIKSIRYNHLNLPTVIRFEPGSTLTNSISYVYDATGNKLEKITNVNNAVATTQYAGSFIYSDMGTTGNLKLQFLSHPEGYVKPVAGTLGSVTGFDTGTGTGTQSSYSYIFQYKDHLGNVRLSYSDADLNGAININNEIVEESNYYPFGLEHKGYNNVVSSNGNSIAQNYKFGGKEYQQELNLNWYDVSARNYDPALGRWMNIDPLAEKMRRHSPYNYAFDNPVYFIDYDGMMPYGSNCCGNKPSPLERIKQGFQTFFSGLSTATEQFFNDNGYSTPSTTSFKPIENKSSNEKLATYADAADKMSTGTKDIAKGSVQGAADAATVAAETVSEASSYTTILTGGASAPVTVPLQKGADAVAATSKTVSASIDYSDGDIEAGNEKMVDAGTDIVIGRAGSRISKEATKHVTDKVDKQVQENVVETVIDWFKDAAKNINFEF